MKAQGVSSKKEEAAKVASLDGNEEGNGSGDTWRTKAASPPKKGANKKQTSIKCFLCNASHPLERCNKLLNMDLEQRTEILKKDGRCYRCLEKKEHIAKFCQSEGFKCATCGYNHPTILCGLRQLMQKKRQEQEASNGNQSSKGNPRKNNATPTTRPSNGNGTGGGGHNNGGSGSGGSGTSGSGHGASGSGSNANNGIRNGNNAGESVVTSGSNAANPSANNLNSA